ncbi:uncharacterized protein LY79DRAFT_551952 [Colletotrichum navitas]|uniref:Uncharacterized protein n=1 Tax=Colletotrichum navitas TaxID=681940 RepID=A0AAD8V5L1_9PEZI|nr:uncharacterized protein LY79DRAFT_551952 [Colletotrichum navitas]KAK1593478.1 hypothetical protein LY79DRAFT_551952 [Colletotrichum navitas]
MLHDNKQQTPGEREGERERERHAAPVDDKLLCMPPILCCSGAEGDGGGAERGRDGNMLEPRSSVLPLCLDCLHFALPLFFISQRLPLVSGPSIRPVPRSYSRCIPSQPSAPRGTYDAAMSTRPATSPGPTLL